MLYPKKSIQGPKYQLSPFLVLCLGWLLAGCSLFSYEYKGFVMNNTEPLPDFSLLSNKDEVFHLSDIEGDIAIVYFGYTFCPDVCPMTLAQVTTMLEEIAAGDDHAAPKQEDYRLDVTVVGETEAEEADNAPSVHTGPDLSRVQVIFVSVDPERDTPEVMDRYVSSFNPDFIGLTADSMADLEVVMEPFGVFAEKDIKEGTRIGYLVNHTSRTYLVAPDRSLIIQYPFGFEIEDLESDLLHLLDEMEG